MEGIKEKLDNMNIFDFCDFLNNMNIFDFCDFLTGQRNNTDIMERLQKFFDVGVNYFFLIILWITKTTQKK